MAMKKEERFYTYEEAKKVVKDLGIKTYREWRAYSSPYILEFGPNNTAIKKGIKRREEMRDPRLPGDPPSFYGKRGQWKGWGDFLGTGAEAKTKGKYLPYEKAKEVVHALKVKNRKEYEDILDVFGSQLGLPPYPYIYYSRQGVNFSWKDFLYPKFPPYEEAKRRLRERPYILTVRDYREARKIDAEIRELPSNPPKSYEDQWEGWEVYLGANEKMDDAREEGVEKDKAENLNGPAQVIKITK